MTALARLEPRADLSSFDAFPDMFRRFLRMADWPSARMSDDMHVDITETDKQYLVKAELPGAKKDDSRVTVDGSYVSISAEVREEKKETTKEDGERVLLHETHYGSWSRGFTLPKEVDDKAAEATFENGVLSLTLPKRAAASANAIAIK
jgi:HSP20 family protein